AQPAHEWNVRQPVMRDEGRAGGAGDRRDVDPAQVVGKHQRAAPRAMSLNADIDSRKPGDAAQEDPGPGIMPPQRKPEIIEQDAAYKPGQHDCQAQKNRQPADRSDQSPRPPPSRSSFTP